jgi:hypothetical protein
VCGDLLQQCVNAPLQGKDVSGDGVGAAHQIAHEPLQIVDQLALVIRHRNRLGLLQLDTARDAGHERLRIFSKALENAYQIPQRFVDLRDIGFGFASQRLKRLQPARDVFERHRLQFSAPLQRLHEKRQRRFDSLPALRETIQEACTVEIAEAGNPRRIRM